MHDRKSLYSRNKRNSRAILCPDAFEQDHPLTPEQFSSEEEFRFWKTWSDEDYHNWELADHIYSDHTSPLTEYSAAEPSPEETILARLDRRESVMFAQSSMQESGGQGFDPMQASESGYNTRYPRTPNAITDPEYSIDVGVQTIADSLRQADVESPVDMENIKLALQGYNFGNGFIPWARENYGGYSAIAAIEFSNRMAAQLGWSGYGDKQYPAHVLRYYPFGRAFTAEGNQAIVEIALTQVGNVGGEPYWSWWGLGERAEWCAMFVSWCADQAGLLNAGAIPKFENCVWGANWFKDNAGWADGSAEPSPGDIIFFDWEPDGYPDHVGIVEKCEGGLVYTIEGNVNDDCAQGRYYVGDTCIFGYGLPAY